MNFELDHEHQMLKELVGKFVPAPRPEAPAQSRNALEPIGMTYHMPLHDVLRMVLLGNDERIGAGTALRIGLASAVLLIAVIGGRIIPSFTRNWLVRRGPGKLPAAPMQGLDKVALLSGL